MKKGAHILFIDNDEAIRRLFGGKLAAAGFEMMYSDNGNDGREIARRMQPDLILLDIRMPDPDGYTIAKRLKDEPKTAEIPVAFFTNEDMTPEAEKMVKDAWVVDYIHKSINLDDFVKRIKKILKG
jgi:DNA-binding response OmpR family regulator